MLAARLPREIAGQKLVMVRLDRLARSVSHPSNRQLVYC